MGKIYVITGSTSGIGKELVETFAANPENVIFAGYRNENKISKNSFQNVINFYIDMTKRETISQAAEFIKSKTLVITFYINIKTIFIITQQQALIVATL